MKNKIPKPRSVVEVLRRRVASLEAFVYNKLQLLNDLSLHDKQEFSTSEDKNHLDLNSLILLFRYLQWLKDNLHYANSLNYDIEGFLIEDTSNNKRKYNSETQKNIKNNFHLNCIPDFKGGGINNNFFINLEYPKNLGPVKVGRYNLSFCLQLVVEVYCNKLDPDLFWLNREQVDKVIRSSDNSLLKYLIIDAALNVSSLTKEEKSDISFLSQDLSSLIISSYNSPSIDGVVALAFLAIEEYLDYNITKAKLYLAKAFRLADILKVNPGLREGDEFFSSTDIYNRNKLWEVLLLTHGNIFFEVPGPPLGRCSTVCNFSHVGSKEQSFPTVSRILEVPLSEKIQIHEIIQDFGTVADNFCDFSTLNLNNVLVKQKRRTVSGINLNMYTETIQLYMKLYQLSLQVQHEYFVNPAAFPHSQLFLTDSERNFYNFKIVGMLNSVPAYFKKPQILTIRSIWNELTPQALLEQDSSNLGNEVYVILLNCLINVNYPITWFDPQPLSLPDSESWQLALKASSALFEFFMNFSSLLQTTKHTNFLVFNLCDSLSATYTYLNAILNCPFISHQYRGVLHHRVQTIIDEIKFLSKQKHLTKHDNATKVLETLKNSLRSFQMPKEFQLHI